MTVRYLEKEEFGRCRSLWEEAFPEDSRSFGDYYFSRKLPRSRVLVKEDAHGKMLTMAHLNPYLLRAGECRFQTDYIVGVATAADSRHQGHMRDVLIKMMEDMHRDKMPFCFLMPASPAIYEPFGFVYIYDQPVLRPDEAALSSFEWREIRLDEEPEKLARWMNGWLEKRYQVYAERDEDYMRLLQAELESEKGSVQGWFDERGELTALRAEWGLGKREQRFFYGKEDRYARLPQKGEGEDVSHPAIMARITNAAEIMKAVHVSEDCPCPSMEVALRIRDPQVKGNDGIWIWRLDRQGGRLDRQGEGTEQAGGCLGSSTEDALVSTEILDISVEKLTAWLFGYRRLEDLLEEEVPFWCDYIQTLQGVFLDEVV